MFLKARSQAITAINRTGAPVSFVSFWMLGKKKGRAAFPAPRPLYNKKAVGLLSLPAAFCFLCKLLSAHVGQTDTVVIISKIKIVSARGCVYHFNKIRIKRIRLSFSPIISVLISRRAGFVKEISQQEIYRDSYCRFSRRICKNDRQGYILLDKLSA